MGIGLLGVFLDDAGALRVARGLHVRPGGLGVDHAGLGDDELVKRIGLVVVPVDGVEGMARRQEAVDLDEELPLLDPAQFDAVLLENLADTTKSFEPDEVFADLEQETPALKQPRMLGVGGMEPAQKTDRQQLLFLDGAPDLIGELVAVHHRPNIGSGYDEMGFSLSISIGTGHCFTPVCSL